MNPPNYADERHADGLKLLNAGKPADAEACFREVVATCPEWPEAHTHLGVALAARGQHADALACFDLAVGSLASASYSSASAAGQVGLSSNGP